MIQELHGSCWWGQTGRQIYYHGVTQQFVHVSSQKCEMSCFLTAHHIMFWMTENLSGCESMHAFCMTHNVHPLSPLCACASCVFGPCHTCGDCLGNLLPWELTALWLFSFCDLQHHLASCGQWWSFIDISSGSFAKICQV